MASHVQTVDGREAYRFAHGHYPRGRGFWAFEMRAAGRANYTHFVQGNNLYRDACRAACAYAREHGFYSVKVCT